MESAPFGQVPRIALVLLLALSRVTLLRGAGGGQQGAGYDDEELDEHVAATPRLAIPSVSPRSQV